MPLFRPLPALLLLALLLSASHAAAKRDVARAGDTGLYLVLLQDPPAPAYAGGVAGFAPTRAKAGGARFAPRSAVALAYVDHLQRAQYGLRAEAQRRLGREVKVRFTYRYALNGLALGLSPAEAARVARLPGVRAVLPDGIDWPQSDASARHIGAEAAWGGGPSALSYRATLSGASVQPPVATAASGSARFTFDLEHDRLAYRVQSEGLVDLSAVHLHDATDDAILHTLPLGGDPLLGEVELDAAQRARLANGGLYIDLHTSAFPAGELRGAIALEGTLGEGVVVGVLDTGINHDHPSFAAVAGDGYVHVNPLGSGSYLGVCVEQPGFCNDKLIGAWTFTGETITPEDTIGHGSHTASTAVGNLLRAPQVALPTRGYDFAYLSGVAPRANLIMYDVCAGGCPNSATAAAVEQAILDGVDVLNYSISGGIAPWTEITSLAFLNATAAGIVVVASAGNNGPAPGTINHVEPWVLSVAATSHPRRFAQSLRVFDGGTAEQAAFVGEGPTAGFEGVLVDAADPPWNNPLCGPFAAAAFSGQAVICRRGGNGRVAKGVNVLAAGGGALVLINDEPSAASLNADPHVLPAVHLPHADGLDLIDLRAQGLAETVRIEGGAVDGLGDAGVLASFSARGPGLRVADVLKPDLAAPGAGVLAATLSTDSGPPAPEFDLQSGTSMATPLVVGLVALLRALRPDWSPAELKSALAGSAAGSLRREDGISPALALETGSGAVDLRRALRAGLLLDEDSAAYAAADPALGGDPRTLNLPALADSRCAGGCGWDRRVRSVLASEQSWSASFELPEGLQGSAEPSQFSLAPGAEQTLAFRVVANGLETSAWHQGALRLDPVPVNHGPDGSGPVPLRLPLAIQLIASNLPERVRIEAAEASGNQSLPMQAIAIDGLQLDWIGLARGQATLRQVPVDPTPGLPFEGDGGTYFVRVDVPEGARRLVAEITTSEAPDADLYLGTGSEPDPDTLVCASTTPEAEEYCNVDDPEPGPHWILVQNWEGSVQAPDAIGVAWGVVPDGEAGNFSVQGPASVASGMAFELSLGWSDARMNPGSRWYGLFRAGSDAANPGNLGTVRVDLVRAGAERVFGDGFEAPLP